MVRQKKIRLAINGFGRIGRAAFKIALEKPEIEVVAINDLADVKVYAHLLKYDSVYGTYERDISVEEGGKRITREGREVQAKHLSGSQGEPDYLVVDGRNVLWISEKDPSQLPWKKLNVDVVLECTGRYTNDGSANVHRAAGAKRVVISAPTKGGEIETFLRGVNEGSYQNQEVISNASCTTNSTSPIAAVMQENFGIVKAMMTTIHAVTAEQNLVDGAPPGLHPDLRRGRSALVNMVPTTTGAAISTTEVIPELKGLFDGLAIRVPIIVGSLSDFTFLVKKKTTVEWVNKTFEQATSSPQYRGVIDVAYEPLVSTDIVKNSHSAIVDLTLTKVVDGDLVKVVAWYDNEWGYSHRLVEMAIHVAK